MQTGEILMISVSVIVVIAAIIFTLLSKGSDSNTQGGGSY